MKLGKLAKKLLIPRFSDCSTLGMWTMALKRRGIGMTFEKWMEEMRKQMAMEMVFPSSDEPAGVCMAEQMKDYIEDDDLEE